MSGATADLVRLIDLSLGSQPSGVVNFNYLHTLMHAIVSRLDSMELAYLSVGGEGGLIPSGPVAGAGEGVYAGGGPVAGGPGEGGAGGGGGGAATVGSKESVPPVTETGAAPTTAGGPSEEKIKDDVDGAKKEPSTAAATTTATPPPPPSSSVAPPVGTGDLSESRVSSSGRVSRAALHHSSAGEAYHRQRSSFVTAANDLGAMERKLQELENRLNAMDTLPELLERKSSDMSATPIKDRWNFTNLSKRLSAAEDGLEQNSTLVDDLLGEVQNIKTAVTGCETSISDMEEKFSAINEQLKVLEDLKMAAAKDSMGEAAAAMMSELQSKIDSLQSELDRVKGTVESLDLTPFATRAELEAGLQQHSQTAQQSAEVVADLGERVGTMEGDLGRLSEQIEELQLLSQVGASSEEKVRLEELGSEVAQLRERLSDMDRAVGALNDAVSTLRDAAAPAEEEDGKYADMESLTALQEVVNQHQQDQERLMGTVAHLSNEMEIDKEHIKALYSSIDELRETKANKDQLEVEVREKADRAALEGKASRDWVSSTFDKLDQQIRQARDQLLGQEEALRSAVHRLDEDVETKLDKGELEPLKDYFDKKLARVKTAPIEREALAEDAAGFRKPLRFRCISCDRPLGLKTAEAIPALPAGGTLPGTRSFRPYTTYELELIRRHQRMGLPVFGPVVQYSRTPRSAGGAHTLTQSRRRVRVAPLSSAYSPEPYAGPPSHVSAHQEVDVMGHDGHIYKGRMSSRNKLPPLKSRGGTSTYY